MDECEPLPGVVGTAYTTVSVVNWSVVRVCRISEGAWNCVNWLPYLPLRGPGQSGQIVAENGLFRPN